jgi:hypothetical protein
VVSRYYGVTGNDRGSWRDRVEPCFESHLFVKKIGGSHKAFNRSQSLVRQENLQSVAAPGQEHHLDFHEQPGDMIGMHVSDKNVIDACVIDSMSLHGGGTAFAGIELQIPVTMPNQDAGVGAVSGWIAAGTAEDNDLRHLQCPIESAF